MQENVELLENRLVSIESDPQEDQEWVVFNSEGLRLSGRLFESEKSDGYAVVFCHGAFEYQDHWFPYAERLNCEGLSTFTFDFPGHGESEGMRSLVDLRVWAYSIRDALNFLSQKGYRKFALVGWGIGGSAALLAAAHDQRLRCAVILSAPVYLVPNLGERLAYGIASLFARLKKSVLRKPMTLSRLNELEELRFILDNEKNRLLLSDPRFMSGYRAIPIPESLDSVWFDITHTIRKVTIPTLVIHGSDDEIVPREQSEKLLDNLVGRKRLELVDQSGHALHLDEKKDETYKLLAKWVKKYLLEP